MNQINIKNKTFWLFIWDNSNDFREWYIGFFLDTNEDGTIRVDHLTKLSKQQSIDWKRPTKDDIQNIELEQILRCAVNGFWDVDCDTPIFKLLNDSDPHLINCHCNDHF